MIMGSLYQPNSRGEATMKQHAHLSHRRPARKLPLLTLMTAMLLTGPVLVPADRALAEEAEPSLSGGETMDKLGAVISLKDEITDVTLESLTRRFEEAKRRDVSVIVLDMDTPGGLVSSSIAIADLIKNLEGIKTVAWVNPNAHSGGAIVAVACDEIVMARSSRIGDSQVISFGPAGAQPIPDEMKPKINTPVINEFRASAKLRGYDTVLCEAFVIPEREVWWLENKVTGEREFVFREEKLKRLGEDEDTDKKKDDADKDENEAPAEKPAETTGGPKADTDWKLVEKYYNPLLDLEVDLDQPVVRDDELLEMSPDRAFAFGFSKGIVRNDGDLENYYGLTSLIRLHRTWLESVALWMTSFYVRGFLLVIIMLGAYVEFNTPGVGVAGLVALIGLAIFVGAPYITGLANVWEVLFVCLGVLLIMLEVFVIPGFGVAGISGLLLLLIGLLATFAPDEPGRSFPLYIPTLDSTLDALKAGVITLTSSMAISILGMIALGRMLPRTSVFRAVIPDNPTPSEVMPDDAYLGAARIGDRGNARTPLRPAGKAAFGTVLVDVVSQGEFIDVDTDVEVIERRGNLVVVRAAQDDAAKSV
ncbi:MAG: NfeD family protein [Planctomycetota bacterium]|jgi:membrane-bound serine protease (ClpP class)